MLVCVGDEIGGYGVQVRTFLGLLVADGHKDHGDLSGSHGDDCVWVWMKLRSLESLASQERLVRLPGTNAIRTSDGCLKPCQCLSRVWERHRDHVQ